MEFFEAPRFTEYVDEYLGDDELRRVQDLLLLNPVAGVVMPGTGGFRKLRWRDRRRGKGRRGGLRIIYYHISAGFQVWFVTVFDKNEASDLSPQEKKALKDSLAEELRKREAQRTWQKKPPRTDR